MKKKNTERSKYDQLKETGQIVTDFKVGPGINSGDTWLPRNIEEYRDLAGYLLRKYCWNLEDFDSLTGLNTFAALALDQSYSLITWSREKDDPVVCYSGSVVYIDKGKPISYTVTKPAILDFWLLVRLITLLKEFHFWPYWADPQDTSDLDPYAKYHWPKNPQSVAFSEAGPSVLQAIIYFANNICDIMYGRFPYATLPSDDGNLSLSTLVMYPAPSDEFLKWEKSVKLRLNDILPESEWPKTKLETHYKSLTWQLDAEYKQAQEQSNIKYKGNDLSLEAESNEQNSPGKSRVKRGRKRDPKIRTRNKEIVKYKTHNPQLTYKEIGKHFGVSGEVVRKACNNR